MRKNGLEKEGLLKVLNVTSISVGSVKIARGLLSHPEIIKGR